MITYRFQSLAEMAAYFEGRATNARNMRHMTKIDQVRHQERASTLEDIATVLRNTVIGDEVPSDTPESFLLMVFDENHRRMRDHESDGSYATLKPMLNALAHSITSPLVGTATVKKVQHAKT